MTILEEGLNTLLIGLGTVFIVLIFLSYAISVIGYFTYKLPMKKAAMKQAQTRASDQTEGLSPAGKLSADCGTSVDTGAIPGDIIAAITATVAAFGQQSSQRLVIRSVRRSTNWNAGR